MKIFFRSFVTPIGTNAHSGGLSVQVRVKSKYEKDRYSIHVTSFPSTITVDEDPFEIEIEMRIFICGMVTEYTNVEIPNSVKITKIAVVDVTHENKEFKFHMIAVSLFCNVISATMSCNSKLDAAIFTIGTKCVMNELWKKKKVTDFPVYVDENGDLAAVMVTKANDVHALWKFEFQDLGSSQNYIVNFSSEDGKFLAFAECPDSLLFGDSEK